MREYEQEKLEEMKLNAENNFEELKKKILLNIRNKGKALGEIIEKIKLSIEEDEELIQKYNEYLNELNTKLQNIKSE